MHILADLRARPDRGPGVDHRPLADMGAEIDERRHQNHALGDIGGLAHDAVGNGTEPGGFPLRIAPSGKLAVDLVPPAAALRAAGLHFHVLDPEPQQNGLLGPLVHMPCAVRLTFRDTQRALVQRLQRCLDGVALIAPCGGGDRIAGFPCSFDGGFQSRTLFIGHDDLPLCPIQGGCWPLRGRFLPSNVDGDVLTLPAQKRADKAVLFAIRVRGFCPDSFAHVAPKGQHEDFVDDDLGH